jgi:hypothetical protein
MTQTREDIRDNIVKIVDKKGNFFGTGFFIDVDNKKYCLTCHHGIFKLDEIYVERNNSRYEVVWIEKYSNMTKDVAVLDVKDCLHKSLNYYKQTIPGLEVFVWGFPSKDVEHFPDGRPVEKIHLGNSSLLLVISFIDIS